jgi:hypothetical protein
VTQDLPAVTDEPEAPARPSRARRFWSHRRVSAAITAAVVLAVAGPVLYDIAAVRAGRTAFAWRKTVAEELATRPLDDLWIITGAAVAAVVGVWLIVLAATPGLRAVLPLRGDTPGTRAGIDRHAAELVLRDRAMEVSGVRAARVTVTRRRAVVRADVHFGETEGLTADLDRAVTEAVTALGLDRPPPVTLRVRRTGVGDHAG